jgi:hypothetical protein
MELRSRVLFILLLTILAAWTFLRDGGMFRLQVRKLTSRFKPEREAAPKFRQFRATAHLGCVLSGDATMAPSSTVAGSFWSLQTLLVVFLVVRINTMKTAS